VEMGTTPLTKGEKKPNVNSYLAMWRGHRFSHAIQLSICDAL
jgi:hypothetical protein